MSRVLVVLCLLAGCGQQAKVQRKPSAPAGEVWMTDAQVTEAKVKVAPLAEQRVDDTIVTSGKVTFDDARVAHIISPVSGRVTKISANVGQRVAKGDVLALLESPDIGVASADLHKANADRIAAEHDFARQKELFAAHASSQRDLEQSEDGFRKAQAEVERAKQKAGLLRTGTSDAVTQVYAIRSEIAGEVIARNISPGAEVAGQYGGGTAVELFTVGELDSVWVISDVYEIDSPRIAIGQSATIKPFAFPRRSIAASIDWISGTLDATTRTTKVRSVVDNRDRSLKPEMYATLYLSVEERRTAAIPRSALLRLGEQTCVFVEKGKTPDGRHAYVRIPIAVDESEGGAWIPVTHDSLPLGALVVVEGGLLLAGADAR